MNGSSDLQDRLSPEMRKKLRSRTRTRDSSAESGRRRSRKNEDKGGSGTSKRKHKRKAKSYRDSDSDDDDDSTRRRSPKRFFYLFMFVFGAVFLILTFVSGDESRVSQSSGSYNDRVPDIAPDTSHHKERHEGDRRRPVDTRTDSPQGGCGKKIRSETVLTFSSSPGFTANEHYYLGTMKCLGDEICRQANVKSAVCEYLNCATGECKNGIPWKCTFEGDSGYEAEVTAVNCRRLDGEACPPCQVVYKITDNSFGYLVFVLPLVLVGTIILLRARRTKAKPVRKSRKRVKKDGARKTKRTAAKAAKAAKPVKQKIVQESDDDASSGAGIPSPRSDDQVTSKKQDDEFSMVSSRLSDDSDNDDDRSAIQSKWNDAKKRNE